MATNSAKPSNSGIRKLSNGESVIPASTRADGSVRKEIKVKPGYRPPEDVEVYKNRTAAAWRNRGSGGVPGAEKTEPTPSPLAQSAAAAKNAKRREARKKAAADSKDNDTAALPNGNTETKQEEVDPEVEAAKEAKKLAKKLRQARELKDKKEGGASLLPEQFAKVIKIQELMRQLDALGFDAEGEKKGEVKATDGKESPAAP